MHPFKERDIIHDIIRDNPGISTKQISKMFQGEWPLHSMLNKLAQTAKAGSRRVGLNDEWFLTGWWDSAEKHCVPMGWDRTNIEKFWAQHPEYRPEGY